MTKKIISGLIALSALYLSSPIAASALEITALSNVPVEGDFVLGPGKVELFLEPGETVTRELNVTNRSGKPLKVSLDIEDFTGDSVNSTLLLGDEKGPYSLKDFLAPEEKSFTLAHGEKANLPVTISLPADTEPGGRYGAVIVRVEPEALNGEEISNEAQGQVALVSRLATLFFIRVKGETKEDGALKTFTTDKKFYQKGPVNFSVVYENKGSVHLNPYANIEIKNAFGKKIDNLEVRPYFVMPGFTREKQASWQRGLALGRYTATISLNRGYANLTDEVQVSFWIIPLKFILIAAGVIFFIALIAWLFLSKFELKRKK